MKKSILALTAFAFTASAILTNCNSPAEKVDNAQKNVADANKDLDKANKEYLADIENYKKETANKIDANQTSINEFNERISKEKMEVRVAYKNKIIELEQKNSDMKKKMDDYKEEGKEKWEKFKTEFTHDMDELGKAFKDLTVQNVK